MRRLLFLALLSTTMLGATQSENWAEKYAPLGRVIVAPFATAPFPHPARAEGHTYKGEHFAAKEHYSDSTVAIFVPAGFRAGEPVDVVVFFHGWFNWVSSVFPQFRLAEQFAASGRNAVLVVPEGPRKAPDSFGGKLEDADGFSRFMAEVMAKLAAEHVVDPAQQHLGRVILAGHSGAYHVMAAILARGGLEKHVAEAWLFDALYGQTEIFEAWAERSGGRLLNVYTDEGGTKEETERHLALLRARGTPCFSGEEKAALAGDLPRRGRIFLHTDLGHSDVIAQREQFRRFLESSGLNAR